MCCASGTPSWAKSNRRGEGSWSSFEVEEGLDPFNFEPEMQNFVFFEVFSLPVYPDQTRLATNSVMPPYSLCRPALSCNFVNVRTRVLARTFHRRTATGRPSVCDTPLHCNHTVSRDFQSNHGFLRYSRCNHAV